MEIQVNITPEQINQTIAEAVAKSAIGEQLQRIIEEQVKKLSSTYQNPMEGVIQQRIREIISAILHTEYEEKIRAAVQARLTDEYVKEIVDKAWDALARRY